ncbi:hypothetical protein B795N_00670 [Marinilactibacillus psychrotolerans]|uniref:hypothetical protein n=1 Tax=Marinilactibacillus psychrotolerans TaxID=191770 RepID=UPI001C7D2925|nr:hypothetical protein [Marinilactibacillus psychrotolerans]GEQ32185.1 hypothetical protein B795N_00670 [Marinilactibacillus psychrotolerans]
MLAKLEELQRRANASWDEMTDSQKQELMNHIFKIAINKEKANDSVFDLMSDIYDRLKKESAE